MLDMEYPMKNDVWGSPATILSTFDTDADGSLDYREFRALCIQLFGIDEIKQNESEVRKIFNLFDADEDGALNAREMHRCYEWIRTTVNPVNILIVVDVQNDFIDGTLALRNCPAGQDGAEVLEPINQILTNGRWDKVVYVQDWHPEDHISFFENLSLRKLHPDSKVRQDMAKLFDTVLFLEPCQLQRLWPRHAVMNTWGSELHKDLLVLPSSGRVYKGRNPEKDMYSGFDNSGLDSADGTTDLEKILFAKSTDVRATHLYVCGLAYDICVKDTCLDGLRLGYRLAIIDDCCRGASPQAIMDAKHLISANGGLVASSDRVLSFVNEGKRSIVMAYQAATQLSRSDLLCD